MNTRYLVINEEDNEVVGLFVRRDFARALMEGLHAEQMRVVGCVMKTYGIVESDVRSTVNWKKPVDG
jgi:CBS domain-containing protein